MKKAVLLIGTIVLAQTVLAADLAPGEKAPDFTLTSIEGQAVSLTDFEGKIVVLEWTNHGCPFVKKHYSTDNMQKLQQTYTGKGVIWLTICSSAPGKQGHMDTAAWKDAVEENGTASTAVLPDPDGTVGRLYGASATPHMFVIGQQGKLAYQGAIDDNPSFNPKTVQGANNYVAEILDKMLAGKTVEPYETKAYGCSVKY